MSWPRRAGYDTAGPYGEGRQRPSSNAPKNTVAPAISGTPAVGSPLTATTGTWTNAPTSFTWQWYSAGVPIGGATAAGHTLGPADLGNLITVVATASNASGSNSATSAAIGPVTAGEPVTPASRVSTADINATSVTGAATHLVKISIYSTRSTPAFLKFYNKASAPVPGSDAALILWRVTVPASVSGAGVQDTYPDGIAFSTGLAYVATASIADTDTTAIGAGELSINIGTE